MNTDAGTVAETPQNRRTESVTGTRANAGDEDAVKTRTRDESTNANNKHPNTKAEQT